MGKQVNVAELLSMLLALQEVFQARLKIVNEMINEISVLANSGETIIDENILTDKQKEAVSILKRGL